MKPNSWSVLAEAVVVLLRTIRVVGLRLTNLIQLFCLSLSQGGFKNLQ